LHLRLLVSFDCVGRERELLCSAATNSSIWITAENCCITSIIWWGLWNMATDDGSPHWSKDFVEHIRTVHFALITVCGALVLLVGSPRSYSPADSLSQLTKIIEAKKQTLDTILGANIVTALTGQIKAGAKIRNRDSFECVVDRLWIGVSRAGENASWYSEYQQQIPDNIDGFKKWWENHESERTFTVAARDYPFKNKTEGLIGSIIDHREAKPSQSIVEFAPSDNTFLEEADSDIHLSLRQSSQKNATGWELAGSQPPYEVIIPVQTESRTLNGSDFIDTGKICHTFDTCFPDLSKATGTLGGMPLESLRQYLLGQMDKGEEVFEAFGLKIKVGQITLWGFVVVLSVQLYLFLHFKELRSKIAPGDSGWDVPWIGVYKSSLSRLVFFSTICILPLLTAGLLAIRGGETLLIPLPRDWRAVSWLITSRLGGYALAFIGSALLAIGTWLYRPTVASVSTIVSQQTSSKKAQQPAEDEDEIVSREE
jgi:hypothetical protein